MNILILGATGFVGSWLTTKLLSNNDYHITCGVKNIEKAKLRFPQAHFMACDFASDGEVDIWLARLKNYDVVINCVGVFYTTKKRMWQLHYKTPKTLYTAAEQLKLKKIIHLSALGIENYETEYATSKRAIEDFLLSLSIPAIILKPSFIYGPGASGGMALLTSLASLPFLTPLPGKGEQKLQPIHVDELSEAITHLVSQSISSSCVLAAVSEVPVSIKDILSNLRSWLGLKKARLLSIPVFLLNLAGKIGNYSQSSLINTSALAMLEKGSTADSTSAGAFQTLTHIKPVSFEEGLTKYPSFERDKWYARLFFMFPLLRICLAIMWIMSALTSALWAREISYQLLDSIHLAKATQPFFLYMASLLNLGIGLALLINYKTRLNCILQVGLVGIYTIIISLWLPAFWLEPFGSVVKNLPIMVSILMLYLKESN